MGTCYQPDRSSEQIDRDIAIMKRAGFNVVRMGDLSWDSFEPLRGNFEFEWFDRIMDKMHANGIRVILDIPGSPAPIWLHRAYPGVDIVNENGARLPPAERYMDDISDPDYVREVGAMAEALTKRYAHHPALLAVGYDNEIGNGFMSYSQADRQRFISWLKIKYGTIEALNKAWATQRWSRRLNAFEDVDLPLAGGPGPSERYLDLHRYWSDVTVARLQELEATRHRNMADIPSISNLWDTAPRRGFDYLSTYKSYVSYGAEGFYPGDPISGALGALMVKGDLPTPIWFNEFTAGGGGNYGTPGRSRTYAYLALIMGAQGILAWTFNSHSGGEEQALFGLLDHDGSPSWKVDEFARIASEFRQLSKFGFPRYTHPEVAIAYSFDSFINSHPNGPSNTTLQYFRPSYTDQVQGAFEPLFRVLSVSLCRVAACQLPQGKDYPRMRRTEVRPICRRRAISALLTPARWSFRTWLAWTPAVMGRPSRLPLCRACAKPARTRSRRMSRSNSANTANRPAIARPAGVVRSRASVKETKPTPRWFSS
ncbi:MAG: beta-galactosidase [Terriglobales bacterium]